jgi:uncharacterized protein (TIGR03435 family)
MIQRILYRNEMRRTIPLSRSYKGGTILTLLACLCTLSSLTISAEAQSAATPAAAGPSSAPPIYDVLVINPSKSADDSVDIYSGNDRFSAKNVSLGTLLAGIYNIRKSLISGLSGQLQSARFDIEAKISDPNRDALKKMTGEQERQMLLPLLAERFQLKTHIETKTLPVFELIVVSGGPKFKLADQTKGGDVGTSIHGFRTHATLTAHDIPMTTLAKSLTDQVHRTVVDKTGIAGNYDLTLQWSNDDNPDAAADPNPPIFTALPEQLGLKLKPAKGPVETLVVDHAEMPSEN